MIGSTQGTVGNTTIPPSAPPFAILRPLTVSADQEYCHIRVLCLGTRASNFDLLQCQADDRAVQKEDRRVSKWTNQRALSSAIERLRSESVMSYWAKLAYVLSALI